MDTMEPLEIYDSVNDKRLTIYVTKQVAEKCRTDNDFAQDLFNKIQDQNVEEGSAIEVETVKAEANIEDYIIEDRSDKEVWSRKATLKLLKSYQKYKSKFNTCKQKKEVWTIIAKDLLQFNIHKSPDKCAEKWKNLLRTYKTINESDALTTRFQFYEEIKNILNNTDFSLSEGESDGGIDEKVYTDSDDNDREHWSKSETLKLLKAYQKHKNKKNTFDNNKSFWEVISSELAKDNIVKTPVKCLVKWKNLFRSYKKNADKGNSITKFPYFHDVKKVVNEDELSQTESGNALDDMDFEPEYTKYFPENEPEIKEIVSWRANETLKLIKAYKAHKHRFGVTPTKKYVWAMISADLAKEDIDKDPEKCENKWKSLLRTYKKGLTHGETTRFYFYDEISDALSGSSTFNEDEVSTTQNDTSVANKRMKHGDSDLDEGSEEENDNAGYEEIIIETEPAKNDEGTANLWNFRETSALIKAYAAYSQSSQSRSEMWKKISEELEKSAIQKTVENCQRKWANMYRTYKAHKLNNSGAGKFSFYKEMDEVLKGDFKTETILDDPDEVANDNTEIKKCKCMERREVEKQKRHLERMQLLKRKLDLEERKVEAFEKYVKHLRVSS